MTNSRKCPTCGKDYKGFRNQESINEYKISQMCQKCQDEMFGEDFAAPAANGHCPNCGKYFYLSNPNEFGGVCSEKCYKQFKAYLEDGLD